jgi:hypothetical protein
MGVDNISMIRNKVKRQELFRNARIEKSKAKVAERKQRAQAEKLHPKLKEVHEHLPRVRADKQERIKTNVPATLETLREFDETIIADHNDQDLQADLASDEFASFFNDANATPSRLYQ